MSEIAKKSAVTFATRISTQAVAVAAGIVLARVLGADAKGSFTFAATVLGTMQMLFAGESAAVAWQYGKQGVPSGAVGAALLRVVLPGGLLVGALLIAIGLSAPDRWPLIAAGIAVPCAIFTQSVSAFFLTDGDIRQINMQTLMVAVGAPVVYIPLIVWFHAGLAAVIWAWAGAFVLTALYSALSARAYFRDRTEFAEGAASLVPEQLRYGAQVSANSVVSFLNFRIDVFLVMFMLGTGALGVYSIGIGVGELTWQLSRPIVTAAFARIARGGMRNAAEMTATCMRHTFALVMCAVVVLVAFAPYLVVKVYGPSFAQAGLVVRLLAPGIIAYSMMPVLATFFSQQLGKPRIPLMLSATSMLACAGLTALLIPRIGIAGGAIATSVSYCVAFSLAVRYFLAATGLRWRSLFLLTPSDRALYIHLAHRIIRWPSTAVARAVNGAKV